MIIVKQCSRCNSTDLVVRERRFRNKKQMCLMCHHCGKFIKVLKKDEKEVYISNGIKLDVIPRKGVIEIELYFTGIDWDINSSKSVYIGKFNSRDEVNLVAQNIIERLLGFKIYYLQKTFINDSITVNDFGSHTLFYITVIKNGLTDIPSSKKKKTTVEFNDINKKLDKLEDKNIAEIMWNELKYEVADDELYDIMDNIEDKYDYKDSDFM